MAVYLSFILYVRIPLRLIDFSQNLDYLLLLPLSARKFHLYVLPAYWLFGSLLNQ